MNIEKYKSRRYFAKCSTSVMASVFALLLCLGQSGCSPESEKIKDAPLAMHLYWLQSMASEEEQLKAVHDAGIRLVEVFGKPSLPAEELKKLLDKYELRALAMYMRNTKKLDDLRGDLDELVAFNRVIGNRTLVVPNVPKDERPDTALGWIAVGKELGQLAKRVEAVGMTLAYHNHGYEMAVFDGKTALELMCEGAGAALKVVLDVPWVANGGQDPVGMLERLSGRVYAIHVRDWSEKQGFGEVGEGELDWSAILSAAKRAGAKSYIIDYAAPADPVASIKTSAAHLREYLP